MQMRLPNREVVTAFFESYINSRKKNWNIPENGPVLSEATKAKQKISTCIDLLGLVQSANTFEDWIEVAYIFDEEEKKENAPWLAWSKRLGQTIHAALSYILSELSVNAQFAEKQKKLVEDCQSLNNEIKDDKSHSANKVDINKKIKNSEELLRHIDTLNNSKDYFKTTYFPAVTLAHDPKAKALGEKKFEDFKSNVLLGNRTNEDCKRILKLKPDSIVNSKVAPIAKPDVKVADQPTVGATQAIVGSSEQNAVTLAGSSTLFSKSNPTSKEVSKPITKRRIKKIEDPIKPAESNRPYNFRH